MENNISVDLTRYVATCPKGLEHVLAKELTQLGAEQVQESVAACYFVADLNAAYYICLWTRIANRVLVLLERKQLNSVEELQATVKNLNWSNWFSVDQSIAVDFNGSNHFIRDSRFGAQVTKDAVNEHFQKQGSDRITVDIVKPDILIYVRLFKARFSIGIDMVGESLHRRGYRQATGSAPLKENLAAGILFLADWQKLSEQGLPLIDPMCGSGTLLIEAGLIANNIAPSYMRQSWQLQNLKNYNQALWKKLRTVAIGGVSQLEQCANNIIGYDIDHSAIALAQKNIDAAGMEDVIEVRQAALEGLSLNQKNSRGLVAVNPPYGKRLGEVDKLEGVYAQIGSWLKKDCLGWEAAVFTGNPDLGWATRLRSWRQHALFNGSINCQLQRYTVQEKNFLDGKLRKTGVFREEALSESATMLANRIKKNQRKLKAWLNANPSICYRVYDADLPEYAVAIDCYPARKVEITKQDKPVVDKGSKLELYFHVQEYAPPPSIDSTAAKKRLQDAINVISALFSVDTKNIILKHRQRQRGTSQYEKQQPQTPDLIVHEQGYQFIVNLGQYLDTGLFLDHRPVRRHLAANIKGKRFLNLFTYTSTATVYAAQAGARSSTSVDMSKTYIQWS